MPEIVHGISLPLFDRLVSAAPIEDQCVILDSISGIQDSIHKDLLRLLNTRSHTHFEKYLTEDLSVLDFGIPEIGVLGTLSGEDKEQLQKIITKAITCFEPRLSNVQVRVQPSVVNHLHLDVCLIAEARVHAEQRRVEFQLALNGVSALGLVA